MKNNTGTSRKQIHSDTVESISSQKIVFIVTGSSVQTCFRTAEEITAHGFKNIALDFRVPGVKDQLKKLKKKNRNIYGVFGVSNGRGARIAVNSGARFIFSIHSDKQIIRKCRKEKVFHSAGALTPNEIHACDELKADSILVYPCKLFNGHEWIRFLVESYPGIKIIPADDFESWEISSYMAAKPFALAKIIDTEKHTDTENLIKEIRNFTAADN